MSLQSRDTEIRDAVDGLLASNRGLASVQLIEGSSINPESIFRFTNLENNELEGKDKVKLSETLISLGQSIAHREFSSGEQKYFVSNVSEQSGASLILLGTRFTAYSSSGSARSGSDKGLWLVLGIWKSSLAAALQHSDLFSSTVIDLQGNVVLKSFEDTGSGLLVPVGQTDIESIAKGGLQFRTWAKNSKNGEPILVTASKLGDFPFVVVSQKRMKQDELEVLRQVRQILLWSWILFLLAVGVNYFAARSVTKRIFSLLNTTMEISSGNFQVRLAETSKDEVGHLSKAVNKMAEDIEALLKVRELAIRQMTELKMAEHIQKTLIPEKVIDRKGIKSVSYFKPATECSGDWWGRFCFGGNLEVLVVADAAGHGIHSALIAALVHSYFATIEQKISQGSTVDTSPEAILLGLNSVMRNSGKGLSTLTLCLFLIDLKDKKIHIASAGHCVPFLIDRSSSRAIPVAGSIVGIDTQLSVGKMTFDLSVGQRFVVYTDGLFECFNVEKMQFKKRHFNKILSDGGSKPVEQFAKDLFCEIDHFFGSQLMTDDVTIVVFDVSAIEQEIGA